MLINTQAGCFQPSAAEALSLYEAGAAESSFDASWLNIYMPSTVASTQAQYVIEACILACCVVFISAYVDATVLGI